MNNVLVADIMTRDPITIKPDTNLLECSKKMIKKRVGSLLLTEKGELKGLITEHDILWAIIKKSKEDLSQIKAEEISPRKIATIRPSATIEEAFKKIKRLKFERLPVVQEKQLKGLLTIRDILNFKPEFYPEIDEISKIREESNKLKRIKRAKERKSVHEGICEECGNQELLYRFNGMLVCDSCMK